MERTVAWSPATISRDLTAGVVVFLVALPLCLGIALASGVPLFAGLLSGIVGGLVVGLISGSHTSVSGPAAGLTAVVAAQLALLGSFEVFLLAVIIAGLIQLALGIARAGALAAFFPSSVITGLLSAIGVILILKQLPHLVGHDTDPEGEMSFEQPDHETTFSELGHLLGGDVHLGAMTVGLVALALLFIGEKWRPLKRSIIPMPLVVVMIGVALSEWFRGWGDGWEIGSRHLVQVPVAKSFGDLLKFWQVPQFSAWLNPAVYTAGITIAIVASLETLLNLEAVDKLDPQRRRSPHNRELVAQGVGNIVAGMIGGLPVTSVIVRSSVNINAGARTKLSAIVHGALLLVSVVFFPWALNRIPLSCLAAILLMTGIKLASPMLFRQMWLAGRYQFLPFIVTLVAIVMTDLLKGILIGLAVSLAFILNSNLRRPVRRIVEKHLGEEVLHIELGNQVSFLNRAALERVLGEAPRGSHVLLDARATDYIDPDILSLIREFKDETAPAHGVQVSLRGFRDKYQLQDEIQFVDYSTRELQDQVTPAQVLEFLREGNERFRTGHRLSRDLGRQVNATAAGQHPLAVVLSCIDSRTPSELIFDLGLGDIFSVRIAGNVISPKVVGSIEFATAVAGARLIMVMGHTRCGAVTAAVQLAVSNQQASQATPCENLDTIVQEIQRAMPENQQSLMRSMDDAEKKQFYDVVATENVRISAREIFQQSRTIQRLVEEERVAIVGAMYDVSTGAVTFHLDEAIGLTPDDRRNFPATGPTRDLLESTFHRPS